MIQTFSDRTNAGWLDTNCLRDYPLTETGPYPRALIADAFIMASTSSGTVVLNSITVSEAVVTAWFSLDSDSEIQGCASAQLSSTGLTPVRISSPAGDMCGSVVFGDPSSAIKLGRGIKMPSAPIPLHVRAFSCIGKSLVSSIKSDSRIGTLEGAVGVESSFPMTTLTEGNNLILTLAGNDNLVLADCQSPYGLPDCACTDAVVVINGVHPDSSGNITLAVESSGSDPVTLQVLESITNRVVIQSSGDPDRYCTRSPVLPDKWGRVAGTDDQNPPDSAYLSRYSDSLSLPVDSPDATTFPSCPTPPPF